MKKALVLLLSCILAMSTLMIGCAAPESSGATNASSGQSSGQSTTEQLVSVYSREDGSGTRGAFVELLGIEEKDESGEKVDRTTTSASITNSTSVMLTAVSGDENAIGYISLGSLNDTVKALVIDGVEPSPETVKDGSYAVSRPFTIVTGKEVSELSQDFITFILSSEGQSIVQDNGYIPVEDSAPAYKSAQLEGKLVVAGSSSVTPVMEKLQEAYTELNPKVTIEIQQSDSTTGVNMTSEGSCDIGMASRELKDSEKEAGLTPTVIAKDGIAVIVNTNNPLDELTSEQVRDIYLGQISSWSKL